MDAKTCKVCLQIKGPSEFYKCKTNSDGLMGKCIICKNLESKNNYLKNREKDIARHKKWNQEHPDWYKNRGRNNQEYRANKRIKERIRHKTDLNFKIKKLIRRRILNALKGNQKSARTIELLGCTIAEFKIHLESKFQPGMTWDNHGFGDDKWHIDHIVPCDAFNLRQEEQQRKCFHYSNAQPLWQKDNLKKSNLLNFNNI